MSDSPPQFRTFAVSFDAIRRQQRYFEVGVSLGLLVVIAVPILFLQNPGISRDLTVLFICLGLLVAICAPFFRRQIMRSFEKSLREMHPTLWLDEQGLQFETADDSGLAWDDLWKMAITRNPAGEARAIQLFPNEGPRVSLWDYERMDELEEALHAVIGPHVSVEDTTRTIDWENPRIVAILTLIMVTLTAFAAWLLFHFGLEWLLEILMHTFFVAMGLAVMFLAPSTTRSPSVQRKHRLGGCGIILMGIGNLLARFL